MSEQQNLIEKYNVKNFKDLLSVCIGKSQSYQLNFLDLLVDHKRWDVDITTNTLIIDETKYDVEFIGTESAANDSWLWADANKSLSEENVLLVKQIPKIGEYYNISELSEANLPLDEQITGHNLSAIACILLGHNNLCYYRGKSDSNSPAVFMFVKNANPKVFDTVDPNRFNRIVMECMNYCDLNHRLFIKSFLELNECLVEETTNTITGTWPNGSTFIATFDEQDRYISANIHMNSSGE